MTTIDKLGEAVTAIIKATNADEFFHIQNDLRFAYREMKEELEALLAERAYLKGMVKGLQQDKDDYVTLLEARTRA